MLLEILIITFVLILVVGLVLTYKNKTTPQQEQYVTFPQTSHEYVTPETPAINHSDTVIVTDISEHKYLVWEDNLTFSWTNNINNATRLIFHENDKQYVQEKNIISNTLRYWDNEVFGNLKYLSLPNSHYTLEMDKNNLIVRGTDFCRSARHTLVDDHGRLSVSNQPQNNLGLFKIRNCPISDDVSGTSSRDVVRSI